MFVRLKLTTRPTVMLPAIHLPSASAILRGRWWSDVKGRIGDVLSCQHNMVCKEEFSRSVRFNRLAKGYIQHVHDKSTPQIGDVIGTGVIWARRKISEAQILGFEP